MKFNIIHLPKVSSTNDYAVERITNHELVEGDIILTDCQELGKGQGNNGWESECGSNLTFSLILEPKFITPSNQFVITQIISLAICELIETTLGGMSDADVKIKWPNDIYIDKDKVTGILIQNFIVGECISYSIVGIGINVNQKKFMSDAKNPISLIHHIKDEMVLEEVLDKLLFHINQYYENLKKDLNFHELKSNYLKRLYKIGTWSVYRDNLGEFEGKIVDVDEFGRLEIITRSGNTRIYMFKEVEFGR